MGWLRARDPDLRIVTRAARVTFASCLGFYVGLYVLDDPVLAVYALFGAAALGALSQVIGTPQQRPWVFGRALLAGYVLVTAGTLLAFNVVAASAGMLVVGFLVAYAGVGGPVLVGVANGLQLFYILPCFPPYAPEDLDSRLIGITVGVGLLALLDRFVRPDPGPVPYESRVTAAATAVGAYASAVATALRGEGDGERIELRRAAHALLEDTRPRRIPVADRPASPSRQDHALSHAAESLRAVAARLIRLDDAATHQGYVHEHAAVLVEAIAEALAEVGSADPEHAPRVDALVSALDQFEQTRLRRLQAAAANGEQLLERIRTGAAAGEAASSTGSLVTAIRVAVGATPPRPVGDDPSDPFWYAVAPWPQLWLRRLSVHLTPRSVYFQNACRIALALVLARVAVWAFDLTHGFWVLLATLSLMRTSAADTRTTLRPAFVGTVAGAVVGGVILIAVGQDTGVYEWALPLVMLAALSAGPLIGIGWGQAGFTLLVCLAFVQVNPSSWRLAEARLVDVVVGGLAGAVIGLLAWPRGGGGQLLVAVTEALSTATAFVRETVATVVTGGSASDLGRQARHRLMFATATFEQHQNERADARADAVDWVALLVVLRGMVRGSEEMRRRFSVEHVSAWPEAAAFVEATASDLEASAQGITMRIQRTGPDLPPAPAPARSATDRELAWLRTELEEPVPDPDVVRLLDVEAWLEDLVHGLAAVPDPDPGPRVTSPAG